MKSAVFLSLIPKGQKKKLRKHIHHHIKKNKIHRNKPTYGHKRLVLRKLKDADERNRIMTQTDGKIYAVPGLEETIFSKQL